MALYVVDLTPDEKARFEAALPGRVLNPVRETEPGKYELGEEKPKTKAYKVELTPEQAESFKAHFPGVELKEISE